MLSTWLFVHPFEHHQTCKQDILKTSKLILMQIGWHKWSTGQAWNVQLLGSVGQRSNSSKAEIDHKNLFSKISQELSDEFWPNVAGTSYCNKCRLCGSNWAVKGEDDMRPKIDSDPGGVIVRDPVGSNRFSSLHQSYKTDWIWMNISVNNIAERLLIQFCKK